MKLAPALLCLAMISLACTPATPPPGRTATTIPSLDVIDIPELAGITIDGNAADWADRGYHIDLLSCNARTRPAVKDLDGRARLAWSDDGLLVCVTVTDDSAYESPDDAELWRADSVELFAVDRRGSNNILQVVVSPGGTKEHPAARRNLNGKLATAEAAQACKTAAVRTASGYCIEALFPWSVLHVSPALGTEMGFQVYVNDTDNTPLRKKLLWFPKDDAFANTSRVNVIRLAEKASPPVESIVTLQTDQLPRLAVQAVTRKSGVHLLRIFDDVGRSRFHEDTESTTGSEAASLLDFRHEIARATMSDDGDLHAATAVVPLPPLDSPARTLEVALQGDSVDLSTITQPALRADRINAADKVAYRFAPYVFSGDAFPKGEFENPERMDMLLGDVRVETRFFDAAFNEVARPGKPGRYGAYVTITAQGVPPMRRFITLFKTNGPIDYDAWKADGRLALPAEVGIDGAFSDSQEISALLRTRFQDGFTQDGWTAQVLAALSEVTPEQVAHSPRSVAIGREQQWWFDLKNHIGLQTTYPSLVYLPKNPPAGQKLPLILFLHGSGERGSDLSMLENGGPRKWAKDHADSPFVVVSLQCPTGEWWNPLQVLANLRQMMKQYPNIDSDRVYLTGLSMGGYGTWSLLQTDPSPFAAAVPICGGGQPVGVADFKDLPIWVVHGGMDRSVNPKQSFRFVEELRKINGRVRFTFYPKAGHNVWTSTYADPRLYDWLLAQKRGQPAEPRSTVPGTQPTEIR